MVSVPWAQEKRSQLRPSSWYGCSVPPVESMYHGCLSNLTVGCGEAEGQTPCILGHQSPPSHWHTVLTPLTAANSVLPQVSAETPPPPGALSLSHLCPTVAAPTSPQLSFPTVRLSDPELRCGHYTGPAQYCVLPAPFGAWATVGVQSCLMHAQTLQDPDSTLPASFTLQFKASSPWVLLMCQTPSPSLAPQSQVYTPVARGGWAVPETGQGPGPPGPGAGRHPREVCQMNTRPPPPSW